MSQVSITETIRDLPDSDVWATYSSIVKELKNRKLIRTNNITGERGEFLAIETYKNNTSLPNLQAAPQGTKNIDAISRAGDRYSIKTVSIKSKTTSIFYGLEPPTSDVKNQKKFEYVILVCLDEDFEPNEILELTWELFLEFKRWHSTMRGWNLTLTHALREKAKIIHLKNNHCIPQGLSV